MGDSDMTTMMTTRTRQATPERWQAALGRALSEGVEVRQVAGSGLWIATSGTDRTVAYTLSVTGTVAHGCECPAGEFGDAVCKHRAAYYYQTGMLDPDPVPPAPAVARPRRSPVVVMQRRDGTVRTSRPIEGDEAA